jgi:radical SAM protein with 4Fe4S-binding SPASM domain
VFCGQDLETQNKKEISIELFRKMFANIPDAPERDFYFSGGGEPLLCRDLFQIISYVKQHSLNTKINIVTNGLLVGRFAEELARADIDRLMVSVHGGTVKTNNLILGIKSCEDIFKNIEMVNEVLKRNNKKLYKVFRTVVSRSNIDDVPEIIIKAANLGVNEVNIIFRRFYPSNGKKENTADSFESLFYDKIRYNDVIIKSKKIARKLNVLFLHESLFSRGLKDRPCLLPWTTILVDWDGDVYPCYGGEIWFRDKVKSGKYSFGNLLNDHLNCIWNCNDYVRLRRTCNRFHKDSFIPECKQCHNSICFKGPDVKYSHILSK